MYIISKNKIIMKKFVIIISGPTATGKSEFSLGLGKYLPIEIINADVGSFYTKLFIGTAKPNWREEKIPHHLFDILDAPINYTAPQFRQDLGLLIQDIWARGNIPVIVGGSAFYIQSFFYKNYDLITPSKDLIAELEMKSCDQLWQLLHHVDPDRANKINMNDRYRLVRALAIWHTQKQKPSDFEQIFDPLSPFYFVYLTRDRDQLYHVINQRVISMIERGWVDEVLSIVDASKQGEHDWVNFLYSKKMIGYDVLVDYLEGKLSQEDFPEIIQLIMQRTRNYAKRQTTFLHKLVKNVEEKKNNHTNKDIQLSNIEVCNLTLCDLSLYIKQLSERILENLK